MSRIHVDTLAELAALLVEAGPLWRPRPFTTARPPWAEAYPEIAAWCEGLGEGEVEGVEAADRLPADAPAVLRAWEARVLAAVGADEGGVVSRSAGWRDAATPVHISEGHRESGLESERVGAATPVHLHVARWQVPARKLAQIEGFAGALAARLGGELAAARVIVDWCGGKAHLGRTLGYRARRPVRVVEREAVYRDEALALAARLGVELDFVARDALAEEAASDVGAGELGVGLHACGALGTRLLRVAAANGAVAVALAPCCLHKEPALLEGPYPWVSEAGRATGLVLDHSALRLATSDEVVARPALREHRRRENAWRLGLDLLLRERRGVDTYTPLGTLPSELLRGTFEGFVHGAAALRGLELPARWEPAAAEAAGWHRARLARAHGLVRSLFRRAIEVACAVDRAALLAECGLESAVVVFAERAVTPRNLLVLGRREG